MGRCRNFVLHVTAIDQSEVRYDQSTLSKNKYVTPPLEYPSLCFMILIQIHAVLNHFLIIIFLRTCPKFSCHRALLTISGREMDSQRI